MKQTIAVKLEPTAEQSQQLHETMEAFNRGCDYVASVAFQKRMVNKIAIQPFVYGTLRSEFSLSAQMAIRAIAKTIEAYKRDRDIQPTFAPHGAMVLDDRLMSFKGLSHVSLLTLSGRILVPMRYGVYQAARIDRAKGQADLILRGGIFYLYLTIDLPSAPPINPSASWGLTWVSRKSRPIVRAISIQVRRSRRFVAVSVNIAAISRRRTLAPRTSGSKRHAAVNPGSFVIPIIKSARSWFNALLFS